MSEKTLQEMSNGEFLNQVDEVFDDLERRAGDSSIGRRVYSELKEEIRRRVLRVSNSALIQPSPPATVEIKYPTFPPIEVEQPGQGNFLPAYHGRPHLVILTHHVAIKLGEFVPVKAADLFYSSIEARGFLRGLEVASQSGWNCDRVPRID